MRYHTLGRDRSGVGRSGVCDRGCSPCPSVSNREMYRDHQCRERTAVETKEDPERGTKSERQGEKNNSEAMRGAPRALPKRTAAWRSRANDEWPRRFLVAPINCTSQCLPRAVKAPRRTPAPTAVLDPSLQCRQSSSMSLTSSP